MIQRKFKVLAIFEDALLVEGEWRSFFGTLTGTREIKGLTTAALRRWLRGDVNIQDVMPEVAPDDRQWLLDGLPSETGPIIKALLGEVDISSSGCEVSND